METKRIRIGNDIRLAVDLRQYLGGNNRNLLEREVYNPGDIDFEDLDANPYVNKDTELYYNGNNSTQSGSSSSGGDGSGITVLPDSASVCIRSVKAILINTTKQDEQIADLKNKSRFIGRFPIDPWMDAFRPNPYDIRCSGYYSWRVNPYCGFGLHPCWDALRKKAIPSIPTEYRAQVLATKKQNVVEVIFPAEHQLLTGKYKLVLVVKIYAPGFNNQNLRTVTLDVPDVFELVKTTEEGADTGFTINVSNIVDKYPTGDELFIPSVDDIYVNEGNLGENELLLNRTDDSTVAVDLSSITSWYDQD